MRNSVGVSSTLSPAAADAVTSRVESERADLGNMFAAAPPDKRLQTRDELGEVERLGQIVVTRPARRIRPDGRGPRRAQ